MCVDAPERGRIRDDLKGFFRGELAFDDLTRALYATDASGFQVEPAGVVSPRDADDLAALVRYCFENSVPLAPRGAGTGVSGESLCRGLVVDLSRHFRAIEAVGPDWVRVQPGVTLDALNARLAVEGRRFAPDPASGAVCTLGGMVATNASGGNAVRHGTVRDHLRELDVVFDNGDRATAGRHPWPLPVDAPPSHRNDILAVLGVVLEENRDLIDQTRTRALFDRLGYGLRGVLANGALDLPKLIAGSEGTLCVVASATLATIPLAESAAVLLSFATLEQALQAIAIVQDHEPAACELLDRRLLSVVRGVDAEFLAPETECVLLVSLEDASAEAARRRAESLVHAVTRTERLAFAGVVGGDEAERRRLWRLREAALPTLYGVRGGPQPALGLEDVGVPVEALGPFLRRVQEILHEHETTASFLVHAAAGQVHTRPFLDLRRPEGVAKLTALAAKVHDRALSLGGSVSTQHGTGLARTPWTARQTGPLYPLMRQVKAIFDPRNLLNPGKIVDPDPRMSSWPMRSASVADPPRLALRWQPRELAEETDRCNGCGHCRTASPASRMCPTFRVLGAEAAAPRGHANALRAILAEGADPKAFSSDALREAADLCVNCKMCRKECPSHIDVPKLMLETKAANVAQHGLSRGDWFLVHLEDVARLGSKAPLVANAVLKSRTLRWVLARLFGLAPSRKMPPFTRKPFLQLAQRRGWTRRPLASRPSVALFVDLHVNWFDPQVGEAAALTLLHNGFDVVVPPGQGSSGMEALAGGDVERARDLARVNLRAFADLAREGVPIVCVEPTSALMFRHDHLDLLDDLDAKQVAERTVDYASFLAGLLDQGKLRTDFHPLDFVVGHHVPCHAKAIGAEDATQKLLRAIPGLGVREIDKSCSGMAGTFGLKRRQYAFSHAIGEPMLAEVRDAGVRYGTSECSQCRMQMEDGAGKRSAHPAQLLALAYGLLPDVERRLKEPIRDLVLR